MELKQDPSQLPTGPSGPIADVTHVSRNLEGFITSALDEPRFVEDEIVYEPWHRDLDKGPPLPELRAGLIDMVRTFYPALIAQEICDVQPMTAPQGEIFKVRIAEPGEFSEHAADLGSSVCTTGAFTPGGCIIGPTFVVNPHLFDHHLPTGLNVTFNQTRV